MAAAHLGATAVRSQWHSGAATGIPSPEIKKALVAGARLYVGIYRMEGEKPGRYLAWSPPRTPKPSFHELEAFGTLVLEP